MTTIVAFEIPAAFCEDNVALMQAAWERDIAKHTDLMVECATITQRQTVLMERLRLGDKAGPDAQPEGAPFEYPVAIDFLSGEAVPDQLSALDQRLLALNIRMRRLEGSILTYEPETGDEAALLLRFVAQVLTTEHRIDREYLADVLDRCAACLVPVWTAPVTPAASNYAVH